MFNKKNYLYFCKYVYLYVKDDYIVYEIIDNNKVSFICRLDILETKESEKSFFSLMLRRNKYLPLVSSLDTILYIRKLGFRV